MKKEELFQKLKDYFLDIVTKNKLSNSNILITSKALTSKEAIGDTKRRDYPIIRGKEVMLQAKYKNSYGQAFTDAPSSFEGSLDDILNLDIINDSHSRGLFIASLNAVMCELELIGNTVHCKNEEPEFCGN